MDKKITAATIIILIISLLSLSILSGCSDDTTLSTKNKVTSREPEPETPESVLLNEIRDGKIVEVYDEFVRLGAGQTKDNWIIINNVKETAQDFRIEPCSMCLFDAETVRIPAGEHKIIEFTVRAEPGQDSIRVKDSLNNAYGYADISVIVE